MDCFKNLLTFIEFKFSNLQKYFVREITFDEVDNKIKMNNAKIQADQNGIPYDAVLKAYLEKEKKDEEDISFWDQFSDDYSD